MQPVNLIEKGGLKSMTGSFNDLFCCSHTKEFMLKLLAAPKNPKLQLFSYLFQHAPVNKFQRFKRSKSCN